MKSDMLPTQTSLVGCPPGCFIIRQQRTQSDATFDAEEALCNMQGLALALKFYFAVLRSNIYEKILKWRQQVLHTSGKKDDSWLTSFCAMLGFAMVLEEVQRTLQIQADAKIAKDEMPYDQAETEARNACERIDDRFQLLVGLFQCKYRDRKWGDNGSFGPSTPQFSEIVTNEFLSNVRQLLDQKLEFPVCHWDTTYMFN
jgi:hypothetical protein